MTLDKFCIRLATNGKTIVDGGNWIVNENYCDPIACPRFAFQGRVPINSTDSDIIYLSFTGGKMVPTGLK